MGAAVLGPAALGGTPARRASLPAWAIAACSLLAALAVLGLIPRSWSAAWAAPLLLFGWARPLLLRAAPAPADRLKLTLFGLAFSPAIGCLVWLALRPLFPAGEAGLEHALAASLLLGALWQAATPRLGESRWGGGSSAALACLVALLLAGAVGFICLRGNAVRLSHHGLLHSAIALASDRALPPGNPWMAGAPLAYYWAWHVLGAFLARLLWVAPTVALAWTNLWAAALSVLATWLCLAPLLARARFEFWALWLSLTGLNLLGGWWIWSAGPWPAVPSEAGELLAQLRGQLVGGPEGAPRFDPRLAFGLSKFGNLSSYPAALAFGLCGLAAAMQALGQGGRQWLHCCAAALGFSLILNPLVGAPWIGIVAVASLLGAGRGGARLALPVALLAWSLPGLWLLRLAAQEFSGPTVAWAFSMARLERTLLPVAPLLPLCVLGLWAQFFGPSEKRPSAGRAWLVLGLCLGPLAVAAAITLPYENEYKFVRAAAWTLPWSAALGLAWLAQRGVTGRAVALLSGFALALLGTSNLSFGARAYLGLARSTVPLQELPLALMPRADGDYAALLEGQLDAQQIEAAASDAATRREAYAYLRNTEALRAADPVLIVDVARPVGSLWCAPESGLARFIEPTNLQGHEAAAMAALDLFVDRPSQALDSRAADAQARLEFVQGLFDSGEPWGELQVRRFEALGRPLVFLLGELERRRDPRLAARLEQFGFQSIWSAGGARLYAWPTSFASRFAAPPR